MSNLSVLPLEALTVDKAFYAALKLNVYASVDDTLIATLLSGAPVVLNDAVKIEVGRFTARKANNLFVPDGSAKSKCSAEFYGFTSHKVREKLKAFSEMGLVDFVGQTLRDAYTYKWRLPVKHWEICSFMRFRKITGTDLSMNLELNRIHRTHGLDPFAFTDFIELYADAHGAEYGNTRWGKRKFEKIKESYAYQSFLKMRLEQLVEEGLVLKEGDKYRLDPKVEDAVHHFDLFVNGVAYHPSLAMCQSCKCDRLCRAGATQMLIKGLNNTTFAPKAADGTPQPAPEAQANGNGLAPETVSSGRTAAKDA
ncbi:MAG TPA: hypothetical protein VNZ52_13720 [Candidatus Thermoplasmatota archaeon]|nr:hypothetical protein [Candidatus Thermoplasmatota archaeon]